MHPLSYNLHVYEEYANDRIALTKKKLCTKTIDANKMMKYR